jgi:hypothetical protein
MSDQFDISWLDRMREPQCPPDPDFPSGKSVDASLGMTPTCTTALPYPAPRCGIYVVECKICERKIGVTTAGRSDDPRSITVACCEIEGKMQ